MAELSRYNVGGDETNFEHSVLKNKFGITEPKILEDAETLLLSDTYEYFLEKLGEESIKFNLSLIFDIHRYFLAPLYSWAGKTRSVEISKDGILFAKTDYIKIALKNFEKILTINLPNVKDTKSDFAFKLAIIHCEINAIHPFREGNGRTIRLFLDLISVKYGYQLIDFGKSSKKDYIDACIKGMDQDYLPMKKIIYKGLKKNESKT